MATPWRRLFGFAAAALLVHLGLTAAYVRALQNHKAIRVDRWFAARAPAHVAVLVTGDSHPRTAVDTRRLGADTVNIALGGQHYLKALYRTRGLVEAAGRTVGTLVLSADPSCFFTGSFDHFAPEYVWGRHVDLLEIGWRRGEPFHYLGLWAKAHVVPYAGELRTLNQIRTNKFGFGDALPDNSFAELTIEAKANLAAVEASDHYRDETIDHELVRAFRELVAWARERGTRVVLVSYPVTAHYDQYVATRGLRERVEAEVLASVVADGTVQVLDYHRLYFGHPELFSDPHHLNDRGREVFTGVLRDALEARGLLGGAP